MIPFIPSPEQTWAAGLGLDIFSGRRDPVFTPVPTPFGFVPFPTGVTPRAGDSSPAGEMFMRRMEGPAVSPDYVPPGLFDFSQPPIHLAGNPKGLNPNRYVAPFDSMTMAQNRAPYDYLMSDPRDPNRTARQLLTRTAANPYGMPALPSPRGPSSTGIPNTVALGTTRNSMPLLPGLVPGAPGSGWSRTWNTTSSPGPLTRLVRDPNNLAGLNPDLQAPLQHAYLNTANWDYPVDGPGFPQPNLQRIYKEANARLIAAGGGPGGAGPNPYVGTVAGDTPGGATSAFQNAQQISNRVREFNLSYQAARDRMEMERQAQAFAQAATRAQFTANQDQRQFENARTMRAEDFAERGFQQGVGERQQSRALNEFSTIENLINNRYMTEGYPGAVAGAQEALTGSLQRTDTLIDAVMKNARGMLEQNPTFKGEVLPGKDGLPYIRAVGTNPDTALQEKLNGQLVASQPYLEARNSFGAIDYANTRLRDVRSGNFVPNRGAAYGVVYDPQSGRYQWSNGGEGMPAPLSMRSGPPQGPQLQSFRGPQFPNVSPRTPGTNFAAQPFIDIEPSAGLPRNESGGYILGPDPGQTAAVPSNLLPAPAPMMPARQTTPGGGGDNLRPVPGTMPVSNRAPAIVSIPNLRRSLASSQGLSTNPGVIAATGLFDEMTRDPMGELRASHDLAGQRLATILLGLRGMGGNQSVIEQMLASQALEQQLTADPYGGYARVMAAGGAQALPTLGASMTGPAAPFLVPAVAGGQAAGGTFADQYAALIAAGVPPDQALTLARTPAAMAGGGAAALAAFLPLLGRLQFGPRAQPPISPPAQQGAPYTTGVFVDPLPYSQPAPTMPGGLPFPMRQVGFQTPQYGPAIPMGPTVPPAQAALNWMRTPNPGIPMGGPGQIDPAVLLNWLRSQSGGGIPMPAPGAQSPAAVINWLQTGGRGPIPMPAPGEPVPSGVYNWLRQ